MSLRARRNAWKREVLTMDFSKVVKARNIAATDVIPVALPVVEARYTCPACQSPTDDLYQIADADTEEVWRKTGVCLPCGEQLIAYYTQQNASRAVNTQGVTVEAHS